MNGFTIRHLFLARVWPERSTLAVIAQQKFPGEFPVVGKLTCLKLANNFVKQFISLISTLGRFARSLLL